MQDRANKGDAITIAQLLGTGFSISTFLLVRDHGTGVHFWDIRITQLSHIKKLAIIQSAMYWLAVLCAKLSIFLFYLRLSPDKHFKMIVHGLLGICIAYCLIGAFAFLFFCQPIAKYWDPSITYGSCTKNTKVWLSTAIINAVTDAFMVLLPIWMLWHIRIPRRQKIGLIAIFMTGVFVTVTSFIRLHFIITLRPNEDNARRTAKAGVWGKVANFVAILRPSIVSLITDITIVLLSYMLV
ncbi:hypothetical protein K469DRAFT_152238 [Zopfia rhizophila CBS 207.26]|uniref:Rhodopsin domain-containing protein n=1 Tax=Zopfia rhizophila CBS 207.26 TaxID=1314779 RepID=A0A6A6E1Y5_9PEZI|nr:hypothetical protein K469DRAFT_152238 [Zopfia rhizophila CBS 207.26]